MKYYTWFHIILAICALLFFIWLAFVSCSHIPIQTFEVSNEMKMDTVWGEYTVILPEGIPDFYNNPESLLGSRYYSAEIVLLQGILKECTYQLWATPNQPIIYGLGVLCNTTLRYWVYPHCGELHTGEPEEVNINEFFLFLEIRTQEEDGPV